MTSRETLLHEENRRLEAKLKECREKHWSTEQNWLKTTEELQAEITSLQNLLKTETNPEIFNLVKGSLDSLQREVNKLREEKINRSELSDIYSEESEIYPKPQVQQVGPLAPKTINDDVLKSYRKILQENTSLRNEVDYCKDRVRKIESLLDEKTVQCKELEVEIATTRKHVQEMESRNSQGICPKDSSCDDQLREIKKELERQQEEIYYFRSESKQLQNALKESKDINRRLEEQIKQSGSQKEKKEEKVSLVQIAVDRRDCLNELMRQLENAWSHNEAQRLCESEFNNKELDDSKKLVKQLEDKNRDLTDENKTLYKKIRRKNVEEAAIPLVQERDHPQRRSPSVSSESKRSGSVAHRMLTSAPPSHHSEEKRRRNAVPEGAHLCVTVVKIFGISRNGKLVSGEGEVFVKLKSIKEKYKTLGKEISETVNIGESFNFYLAQPHEDIISLHVYFRSRALSKEYHIGDCCFSLATLYKGVPRTRIAPIVQYPGETSATSAGNLEVRLQTDDFGLPRVPSVAEVEAEQERFKHRVMLYERESPEKLHAVDVFLATEPGK